MRLVSKIDSSVNFVEESLQGFLESRYVRKCEDYFICYLSSNENCDRGCKFCFLTAMKQTKSLDALPVDFLSQASKVLKHYNKIEEPAKYVHFNFMARGEPLHNKNIVNNADQILYDLGKLATSFDNNLGVKFNISTIMPRDLNKKLKDIFKIIHPTIYYSMYSTNPEFRKKWMPNAMDVDLVFEILKDYQIYSKKKIKIHHCFIKNENDSTQDVFEMLKMIKKYDLDCEFNLVRYNPFSADQGEESDQETIDRNIKIIRMSLGKNKVQIIPRVGFDVNASCGMFV